MVRNIKPAESKEQTQKQENGQQTYREPEVDCPKEVKIGLNDAYTTGGLGGACPLGK
jgi:hypothetical protein